MRCASCCASQCHEQRSADRITNTPADGLCGGDVRRAGAFQDGSTSIRRRGAPSGTGLQHLFCYGSRFLRRVCDTVGVDFEFYAVVTCVPIRRACVRAHAVARSHAVRRDNFLAAYCRPTFHFVRSFYCHELTELFTSEWLLLIAEIPRLSPQAYTRCCIRPV